jgi:hypothetical protein
MSIGNLKDQGNQGKNTPWQLRVLNGLQAIADNTGGSVDCCKDTLNYLDAILTVLQGTARTPQITSSSTSGSTPNAYSVSIANVGAGVGVINGVNIPAGTTLNFDGGFNNLLDPMSFNATGTTFIITSIV